MLEPESRHALLDNLRPPAGFILDRAVGTTYTLDLMALLTAPLAFALFDRVRSEDSELAVDPIALLEAVRRHADRIDIFCQAGMIAPMGSYRPIVTYLEQSIHAAVPPSPTAIFHPKVWVLRFRDPESGERRHRFLCLSRNLTFDQSWDTALVMDGRAGDSHDGNAPLQAFVNALPELAIGQVAPDRVAAVREVADELSTVHFELPSGFHDLRLWPLGHDTDDRWPFEGRVDRMLVISPFLTAGALARLRGKRRNDAVVSRAETIDHLGASPFESYSEVLILSPDANLADDLAEEDGAGKPTGTEPMTKPYLEGLHAKCYVADSGMDARVWTGSANATDAAFGGNVEFLVELIGRRRKVGIDKFLADPASAGQPTLRSILEPYSPPAEPVPLSSDEEFDLDLDVARRRLGSLVWTAEAESIGTDVYSLVVRGLPGRGDPLGTDHGALRLWPMSIRGAATRLDAVGGGLEAIFPTVSLEALSSFFVLEFGVERAGKRMTETMAVNATLSGAPADRTQRLLASLLRDRGELIRFLMMLLSDAGILSLGAGTGAEGGVWAWAGSAGSESLLEPLLRALAADPTRLDEIASLVEELSKTPEGTSMLPDGWAEIWKPIWDARKEAVA